MVKRIPKKPKPAPAHQWCWPVPNNVPWAFPHDDGRANYDGHGGWFGVPDDLNECHYGGVFLPAEKYSPVHAVEAGTIVMIGPIEVLVEGVSGVVRYTNVEYDAMDDNEDPKKVGDLVACGERLGSLVPLSYGLWVSLHPVGFRDERYDHGFTWKLNTPQPAWILDPSPLLLGAWSRITDRFHKDCQPIPTDSAGKRAAILALKRHPLWHHTNTVKMPPNEDAMFVDPPEGEMKEAGYLMMATPDETWIEEEYQEGSYFECIDVDQVYVDPTIERIRGEGGYESVDPRDTDFRVWLEGGGWDDMSKYDANNWPVPEGGWNDDNKWIKCHDHKLDCGGVDLQEAMLNLYVRLMWYYGKDGTNHRPDVPKDCDGELDEHGDYITNCVRGKDGFCTKCGYVVRDRWNQGD